MPLLDIPFRPRRPCSCFDCDPWTFWAAPLPTESSMPNQWAVDHRLGCRPTRHPREISSFCGHCVWSGMWGRGYIILPGPHWECKFNSFRFIFIYLCFLHREGEREQPPHPKKGKTKTKHYIQSDHFEHVWLQSPWGLKRRLMSINHNQTLGSNISHIYIYISYIWWLIYI